MLLDPLNLVVYRLLHQPASLGTPLVPGVVGAVAVGALRRYGLFAFVLRQALVRVVTEAADAASGGLCAACLRVPVCMALVTANRVLGVRAKVVAAH